MACQVLVVDDASFVRMMIRQVLGRMGLAHIEAANGNEAIELYKAYRPALTLLDITMPELDGLAALREIVGFDPDAKVIMCSAVTEETIVNEALSRGALDFVFKPFRPDDLEKMIAKHLA